MGGGDYDLISARILGIDPETGKRSKGLEAQAENAMDTVLKILDEVGWGPSDIDFARIYLTDMSQYEEVNGIYVKKLGVVDFLPARALTSPSELPLGIGTKFGMRFTASGSNISDAAKTKYDLS